jgi:hypothetical protein
MVFTSNSFTPVFSLTVDSAPIPNSLNGTAIPKRSNSLEEIRRKKKGLNVPTVSTSYKSEAHPLMPQAKDFSGGMHV